MTKDDALDLAHRYRIPLGEGFHTLGSGVVENIIAAADEWKYRKPIDANGSRARYFYAYMQRAASRD